MKNTCAPPRQSSRATRLQTELPFLTLRPFFAQMVHLRQSRTERPFQPVFRGGKQRFSVLPTAGFRKGRGLAIGERQRMVQNPPACPTIAFPIARQWLTHWRAVSFSLSYSNCGTCADFSVCGNFSAEKGEKAVSSVFPDVFPPFFSV